MVNEMGSANSILSSISGQTNLPEKIVSVSELENSGINFNSHNTNSEIKKIIGSDPIVVTSDNIIFTTDATLPNCMRVKTILRALGKTQTIIVSNAVIGHLQALQLEDELVADKIVKADVLTDIKDSAIQKFFDSIVSEAISQRASDIKIYIRRDNKGQVYFKINGEYILQRGFSHKKENLYKKMMTAVVDFTLHKNGGDSSVNFRSDIPMDLQLPMNVEKVGNIKLRMGSIPGEHESLSISLRIPQNGNTSRIPTLAELGFTPEHVALIEDALKAPFGLILFTGPTGSGKTTTIASALTLLPDNSPTITLEDPVEISIPNKPSIIQCPIFEDDPERDWAAMLRQTLRQDPDTIMIGEIRDPSVAKTLNRAAGTGHLVLSTLHVNSVVDIPSALEFYELPLYKIADSNFLRTAVGSRLVRAVCPHCSHSLADLPDSDRNLHRLKTYFHSSLESVRVKNDEGCEKCNFSGTSGRKLIAEVVNFDGMARKFILEQRYEEWRAYLKKMGWLDMKDHAESLVRQGLVCPFEAESNIVSPFGIDTGVNSSFNYGEFRETLSVGKSINER